MPIRGRARDVGSSNITCASDAIFHHKRLLEIFRQISTRHPSHNISSTASAEPYYYGDRLTWPIRLLRMSQRGDGKSSNQSKDAAMEPAQRGVMSTNTGGSHVCSKGWQHVSFQLYLRSGIAAAVHSPPSAHSSALSCKEPLFAHLLLSSAAMNEWVSVGTRNIGGSPEQIPLGQRGPYFLARYLRLLSKLLNIETGYCPVLHDGLPVDDDSLDVVTNAALDQAFHRISNWSEP